MKLYLYSKSCSRSSSCQCTTCGPPSFSKLKWVPWVPMSLHSNDAHACRGSSEVAARRERSEVCDREGAMVLDVLPTADGQVDTGKLVFNGFGGSLVGIREEGEGL